MGVAATLPELIEWTLIHIVDWFEISCLGIGLSLVLFRFE